MRKVFADEAFVQKDTQIFANYCLTVRKRGNLAMVYDFACKIKNINNKDALDSEALSNIVDSVNASHGIALEFRFVLPNNEPVPEFLVKAQASVSSMAALHDRELETAVVSFISYLEEIANAIEGEISTNDGFYCNSKTFKKLFT